MLYSFGRWPMGGDLLFAQTAGRSKLEDYLWEMVPYYALLIGLLFVLALIIGAVRSYLRAEKPSETESFSLMSEFRKMQESGELTSEEYAKIKRKLAKGSLSSKAKFGDEAAPAEGEQATSPSNTPPTALAPRHDSRKNTAEDNDEE